MQYKIVFHKFFHCHMYFSLCERVLFWRKLTTNILSFKKPHLRRNKYFVLKLPICYILRYNNIFFHVAERAYYQECNAGTTYRGISWANLNRRANYNSK